GFASYRAATVRERSAHKPSPASSVKPQTGAATGHHPQPRTHQLHGRHQRKRDESGPEEGISENRACHGVGRDSRRIVVRRSGNQPRSQIGKKPPQESAPLLADSTGMLPLRNSRHDVSQSHCTTAPVCGLTGDAGDGLCADRSLTVAARGLAKPKHRPPPLLSFYFTWGLG